MYRTIFFLAILFGVRLFFPNDCLAKNEKKFVVVLDAGHGGGDPGTTHRKGKKDEKTIVLDVALRLGKMIEQKNKDVKVVYTRTSDIYPSLPDRTQIAKNAQGDLFISIHINAAPNRDAHGIETYVFGVTGLAGKSASEQKRIRERMANERENLDISGKQIDFDKDMDIETKILCQAQREKNNIHSEEVAKYVHNALLAGLKKTSYKDKVFDRGIKEKNIFVLCYSPMPAILVELGYLSNAEEEMFLNTEEAMKAFTNALYSGFTKYKTAWDKRKLSENDAEEENVTEPENVTEAEIVPETETKTEPEPKIVEEKPAEKKPVKVEEKPAEKKTVEEKPAVEKPVKAEETPAKVIYKIQFLSTDKILKDGHKELKGLSPVSYYKDGKMYRYVYGSADSVSELTGELKKVKKLFPDAFIIKTDAQGNRIR